MGMKWQRMAAKVLSIFMAPMQTRYFHQFGRYSRPVPLWRAHRLLSVMAHQKKPLKRCWLKSAPNKLRHTDAKTAARFRRPCLRRYESTI